MCVLYNRCSVVGINMTLFKGYFDRLVLCHWADSTGLWFFHLIGELAASLKVSLRNIAEHTHIYIYMYILKKVLCIYLLWKHFNCQNCAYRLFEHVIHVTVYTGLASIGCYRDPSKRKPLIHVHIYILTFSFVNHVDKYFGGTFAVDVYTCTNCRNIF